MCIICALPIGTTLSDEEFNRCWDNNPDGGGYAYVNDAGKIIIKKFLSKEPMRQSFKTIKSMYPKSPFLVHFRIATHGSECLDNTHPFVVNDNLVMAHNGILHQVSKYMDSDDDRSDTRIFIDEILKKLPENWLENDTICLLINDFIGSNNKLCFLTSNGDMFHMGGSGEKEEETGRWFSNTSYKWSKSPVVVYSQYDWEKDWTAEDKKRGYRSYTRSSRYDGSQFAGKVWDSSTGKWKTKDDEKDKQDEKDADDFVTKYQNRHRDKPFATTPWPKDEDNVQTIETSPCVICGTLVPEEELGLDGICMGCDRELAGLLV